LKLEKKILIFFIFFLGGPNGEWSSVKDPHSIITEGKRSRADFIRDAILAWKKNKTDFENW
jgi:hypothetical protein